MHKRVAIKSFCLKNILVAGILNEKEPFNKTFQDAGIIAALQFFKDFVLQRYHISNRITFV